jgi:hypothetical protein
LRAFLYGLNHAVFTATTGAALGYAREASSHARALAVVLAGLGAAIVQHQLWNVVASHKIVELLCDPPAVDAACRATPSATNLYVVVPLIVLLTIGPGAAALVTAASRRR